MSKEIKYGSLVSIKKTGERGMVVGVDDPTMDRDYDPATHPDTTLDFKVKILGSDETRWLHPHELELFEYPA